MSRAIDLLKRCEEEILNSLLHLLEKIRSFTDSELVMIGGYALRAFINFQDLPGLRFYLNQKKCWNIDEMKEILPKGYSIEEEQKLGSYDF